LIVLSGLVPLFSIHHPFGGQLVDKLVVSLVVSLVVKKG